MTGPDLSPGDRQAILDLVTRADAAATRRDVDAYLACLTPGAQIDGEEGTHRGLEDLRRDLPAIWEREGPATAHLTLNPVVHAESGAADEVTVESLLVILRGGTAPVLLGVLTVEQWVVRSGDGWRIRRRHIARLGGPAAGSPA